MERSPVPTTLEISNHQSAITEKPSFASQLVHKMLRYFADKLTPYRTPSEGQSSDPDGPKPSSEYTPYEIHFPEAEALPARSHHDSLIAKVGYTVDSLKPESMSIQELIVWVARYLHNQAEPISGDSASDKPKLDRILHTMQSSKPEFSQNLEKAVFSLLQTISRQEELPAEVASLRFNLKKLARKAKFQTCQPFISTKPKKHRSA